MRIAEDEHQTARAYIEKSQLLGQKNNERRNSHDLLLQTSPGAKRKEQLGRSPSPTGNSPAGPTHKQGYNVEGTSSGISTSNIKLSTFHQRSQLINALFYRKALNETKINQRRKMSRTCMSRASLTKVDLLSSTPAAEIDFLRELLKMPNHSD